MAKPLVSVCFITAQRDRPLEPPRDQESVYDLLRESLENQTYTGPVELILADANLDRLQQEHAAAQSWGNSSRVIFTRQVQHDRTAISGARNTAGAYARGELIVFVDDCTELLPSFLDGIVDLHRHKKVGTRVYLHSSPERLLGGKTPTLELLRTRKFDLTDPVWRNAGSPTDLTEWPLSGNACGVFAMPREAFLQLNGFDENFDGNWGCEDIEFWTRFDRLGLRRVGRADLAVVRWAHNSTPGRKTLRRCREAYAQWAYKTPRREANRRISDAQIDEMRWAPFCNTIVGGPTCGLCSADDRAQQLESYRTIPADFNLRELSAIYGKREGGIYLDTWR